MTLVQIRNGKAQLVVAPKQVAVLNPEIRELIRLKVGADGRMAGIPKERSEIDNALDAVVKDDPQSVPPRMLRPQHIDAYTLDKCHRSLRFTVTDGSACFTVIGLAAE